MHRCIAFGNPPQFTYFPLGFSTVLPCLLLGLLHLEKEFPPSILWLLRHGWVGWSANKNPHFRHRGMQPSAASGAQGSTL